MNPMKIYNRLPAWAQTLAVSLEGLRIQKKRYDALFEAQYREFMSRNNWTYAQKCEFRDAQLRNMVKHCYETVPYYRRLFDDLHIDYRSIQRLEDLQCLPILDKQTIRAHYEEFFSESYDRTQLIEQHTSGSTGTGFSFYQNREAHAAVWAHVWRGNHNIGLNREMWCAYFGGRSIVPPGRKNGPCYRINYPGRQIMFSIYHMNDRTFAQWVKVLNKHRPPWIQGYPSALVPFAAFLERSGQRLDYVPQVITLSSENVSWAQEDYLHRIFGVYPMQNYAQCEAVATFRQRLDRKIFVDEDFAAVELIPTGQDNLCRIVGTTLSNFAMPFLRYDTKDLATWRLTEEGREILTLDGRDEDDIRLRDGGSVRRLSRVFQDQLHITEAQIIQKSLDMAEFHVVCAPEFTPADEQRLAQAIGGYLNGRIGWKIVRTERLIRNKNGKVRFIISEL
ncbi:MAG: phenylacetate--CoA ligase family protein [Clostridia bacterium]|nr:phenylacetate--CoA ligase family protein [Clostridia bacterium]